MNILSTRNFFRFAGCWAMLFTAFFPIAAAKADAPEPGRFLLIFETSATVKKNLPAVKQALDEILSSNLQHEMQENDDLAVWTVDQDLHTGTFPLASWAPEDAEMYSSRLKDFLGRQKFTRHASLAAIQPLLNRVVKTSERLTILIFCDSEGHLLGTPYDSGVNDIIKKSAAETKGGAGLFILALRAYRGEYLGGSVNRTGLVNFPRFPQPPKPEPPVASKPTTPAVTPVVPVPALIIVGTNVATNITAVIKPATPQPPSETKPISQPAVQPASPPATNPPVVELPVVTPKVVATPPVIPAPVSNPPAAIKPESAPPPSIQKTPAPEPIAVAPVAPAPVIVVATNPPTVSTSTNLPATAGTTEDTSSDSGFKHLILISGGLLVAAVGLVIWLMTRSRGPRGSLITNSMQDDPRLPPRK